jgi:hypothetical protein
MTRPSHPPRLDYSDYTWRRVQITKLLILCNTEVIMIGARFIRSLVLADKALLCYTQKLRVCSSDHVCRWHKQLLISLKHDSYQCWRIGLDSSWISAPKNSFITERCYRALLYPPSLPNTQFADCISMYLKKKNSVVWVRERTIPTECPPLVREVSANFWG